MISLKNDLYTCGYDGYNLIENTFIPQKMDKQSIGLHDNNLVINAIACKDTTYLVVL